MERGNRKLQYLTAFVVSIGAVTTGVSMNWNTPVIPKFHDNETNFHLTEGQLSWMAAISSPGFMTGSMASRFTSDKYGRRATILGSALPVIIGTVLIATTANVWLLYIGKILWGCGGGIFSTVSSIYLAEIADKEIRGSLTVMLRYMLYFGCFLVMTIGPLVSYHNLNYTILALPISFFVACWCIPETPYYYLKEGEVNKARRVLKRLTKCNEDEVLEDRLSQMRADVKKEMSRSGSLKELFTGKEYRKALIILIGLKLTQIMSGSNAIAQYLGRITQESNTSLNVSTALIIFGAVRFVLGVMSSALVDRLGRRPLLIYSYFGTGLSLIGVGAYFFKQQVFGRGDEQYGVYGYIPFIGINLASIMSSLGFQSVVALITAEIFPINVKFLAMTLSNILGGLLNFTTVKSYQNLKDFVGLCGVFWFYAFVAFIGAMFSFIVVPETKGKSLREIQVILQGDVYDEAAENLNKVREDNEMKVLEGSLPERKDG